MHYLDVQLTLTIDDFFGFPDLSNHECNEFHTLQSTRDFDLWAEECHGLSFQQLWYVLK